MSYALAIHGGAGELSRAATSAERERAFRHGLSAALRVGQAVLEVGGSALDAVENAVAALEDDPLFNAGRGAVLTAAGTVELDAAIMDGATLRAGAVAQITRLKNPIRLARRILEQSAHVLLVGAGAEAFATAAGFELVTPDYFAIDERRRQLERLQKRLQQAGGVVAQKWPAQIETDEPLGTVGAVARDLAGNLAAATSTGGTTGKLPGRVGDSPLIGAGTYADNDSCAVSTSGHGEWFIRTVQAYDIVARLRYGGATLEAAVTSAIQQRLVQLGAAGGLIAIDKQGVICMRHNTTAMFRASVRAGAAPEVAIY